MTQKKRIVFTLVLGSISFLIYVAGMEIALRVQQKIGPYYDLVNPQFLRAYNEPSNLINHVYKLQTETTAHDKYRIRKNSKRPFYKNDSKPRLLILGDSFTAGLDDANTYPQAVWEYFEKKNPNHNTYVMNAGCPSYSVVSYLIQARHLVDVLKPDYLVVNVDESDLANDNGAESRLVRDYEGRIVAHLASYKADMLTRLSQEMQSQPLYLQRFFTRLFTTQAIFPVLDDLYDVPLKTSEAERLFYVSRESEADAKTIYSKDIAIFERNLNELAQNIKRNKHQPKVVVFSTHAHLQHFVPLDRGKKWNRLIAKTIGSVAYKHGFHFYDGYGDLAKIFKDKPEKFYIPNDMHLNGKGLHAYGKGLGRYLNAAIHIQPVRRGLSSAGE